LAFLKDTNQ